MSLGMVLHLYSYQDSNSKKLIWVLRWFGTYSLFVKSRFDLHFFNKSIFVCASYPGEGIRRRLQTKNPKVIFILCTICRAAPSVLLIYLVLWWRHLLQYSVYHKAVKRLSVFLSRSFQDISCLYEVIIFIAKRNYFVDVMLTVKFILADESFNASRDFARDVR